MTNTPIDWKIFEYKFSANPRQAFESLCYILFCYELEQDYGIFRYFNQPYIETQPVASSDGNVTGFQAKYYDASTALSSKQKDLKDAIKGAKDKYTGINRIIFYVNKEFSTSTKKDTDKPAYQKNIESYGKRLGIKIEWRVQSNFEKMLLSNDLVTLRDLYFNPNPGIQRFGEEIEARSKAILSSIKTNIKYRGQEIKILQGRQQLNDFKSSESNSFIVYGDAGTGKSGLIKDFILDSSKKDKDIVSLLFAATDMDVEEEILFLNQYGDYRLNDLFSLYKNEKTKICIIDAAEKYSTFKYPNTFKRVIRRFIDNDWKVIITIRTVYKEGFCNQFFEEGNYDDYKIERIEETALITLSKQNDFVLPTDPKMRSLLCNLFYLKLYLSLSNLSTDVPLNTELFVERIWKEVIRNDLQRFNNLPVKRESFILNMVFNMLQKENYVYQINSSDDYEALSSLEESGIITPYNDSADLFMMSHDVYEEIVIKQIFSNRYKDNMSVEEMFRGFGISLRSRKMFRLWLEAQLEYFNENCLELLINLLESEQLEQSWKDEALIALIESDNIEAFQILESMLGKDDHKLFTRTVFLLNTACRNINLQILKIVPKTGMNQYRFTKPVGKAWHTIFLYINNNRSLISWSTKNLMVVTNALKAWVESYGSGETTKLAGGIALFLKKHVWVTSEYKYSLQKDENFQTINDIILSAASEIKNELEEIYENIIDDGTYSRSMEHYVLLQKSVSNIYECKRVWIALPSKILQLSKLYWLYQEVDGFHHSPSDMEDYFGINQHMRHEYYPVSAFQTPMYLLLRVKPKESIDCILELTNYTGDCYKKSHLERDYNECCEIEIIFSDTEKVNQLCSDRLWKLHRGTSVGPNLLENILMALEKWLLEMVKEESQKTAVDYCVYLIKNATNVAVTSVVVSVIIANPDKLFEVSCILLKTKEIFHFDISRYVSESSANFLKGMQRKGQLFDKERIESNNEKFRQIKFEDVIVNYQLSGGALSYEKFSIRKEQLYTSIDEAIQNMDSWDIGYKYAYYRMDLRKYKEQGKIASQDGNNYLVLETDMPEELVESSNENQKVREQFHKYTELSLWAHSRYSKDKEKYKKYSQYENEPVAALDEAILISNEEDSEIRFMNMSTMIYTCSVLLRDFKMLLNEKQIAFCNKAVLELGYNIIDKSTIRQIGDGTEAIIPELARLASSSNLQAEWDNPLFLLLAIVMGYGKERDNAADCIAKILWNNDKEAAMKLVYAYVQMIPHYTKLVKCHNGMEPIEFFEKYKRQVENNLTKDIKTLEGVDSSALEFDSLMILHTMLGYKDESVCELVLNTGQLIWVNLFNKDYESGSSLRNYELEYKYKEWMANYILNLSENNQDKFLQTLMPLIKFNGEFGQWLRAIIVAEDINPRYDAFWHVWGGLQNYIFSKCDSSKQYYENPQNNVSIGYGFDEMLVNYLLAFEGWNENVKSWHTLKDENAIFYKMVANRIGYNVATLYSISRVLNSVGADTFANEGVDWLSTILKNNVHLRECSLPVNTLYYIEEYIYCYIRREQYNFRTNDSKRRKVLDVLDFLVDRGSTVGFLLREDII